jgi:hypothetical protein
MSGTEEEWKESVTGILEEVDEVRSASIDFLQGILESSRDDPGYIPTLRDIQEFARGITEIHHRRHQLRGCVDCGPALWKEVDGHMMLRDRRES